MLRQVTPLPLLRHGKQTWSNYFKYGLRKSGVVWHQWTIVAKTATSKLSVTRVITQHQRRDHHITPVLIPLHWLPVPWHIHYKILDLIFRAKHNLVPEYIAYIIIKYRPGHQLRSVGSRLLRIPHPNFVTLWSAWLFCDVCAPVERFPGQSAQYTIT